MRRQCVSLWRAGNWRAYLKMQDCSTLSSTMKLSNLSVLLKFYSLLFLCPNPTPVEFNNFFFFWLVKLFFVLNLEFLLHCTFLHLNLIQKKVSFLLLFGGGKNTGSPLKVYSQLVLFK